MSRPFRPERTPLTEDQLEMRRLVYKQAKTHPDTFDMNFWEHRDYQVTPQGFETCNTTRCIAGWAQYFMRGSVREHNVEYAAIRLLGLTRAEWRMADNDPRNSPSAYQRVDRDGQPGLFYVDDAPALDALRKLAEG